MICQTGSDILTFCPTYDESVCPRYDESAWSRGVARWSGGRTEQKEGTDRRNRRTDGRNRRMDRRTDEQTDGRNGSTEKERTDGQMDRPVVGRSGGKRWDWGNEGA